MAETVLSAFVSDMRGKVGDIIYLRHNGHLLTKAYKKPANPQSSYQTVVRNNWASLLSAWGSLTDTSRFTWKFAATQIFLRNNTGVKFHPTAQQLFMQCNQNLFDAGLSMITDFVSPQVITSLVSPSAYFFSHPISPHPLTQVLINFTGQTSAGNLIYLIFATDNLSAGISNGNKYLRLIGTIPSNTSDSVDITGLYSGRYLSISYDGKVFFRIKPIDISSGFAGQALNFSTIIQH